MEIVKEPCERTRAKKNMLGTQYGAEPGRYVPVRKNAWNPIIDCLYKIGRDGGNKHKMDHSILFEMSQEVLSLSPRGEP